MVARCLVNSRLGCIWLIATPGLPCWLVDAPGVPRLENAADWSRCKGDRHD
jgi:hypothetical protein